MFYKKTAWENMVLGYYSGSQIYIILYGDKSEERRYGEEVMFFEVERFHMYAVDFFYDMEDRTGKRWPVFMRPALLKTLSYINDPRYLEGCRTQLLLQMECKLNGRKANVQFVNTIAPKAF